uniref:HAT C-terminal dimerisation domain-containing protein n=1 Tax=Trichuris muris TaxID=70415 RepID=A0A5S6Q1F4_TRIMR
MVGCHRGFISQLIKIVPNVLSIHCVLHRQHLVARRLSPRLNESLQYGINAVNKIKSNPLNDRLFRQLCDENNEEFNRLLLHTEIRWISKGACLPRFFQLFDSVLQFSEEDDASLTENLRIRKADVAYLADLYFMFNEICKQLLTEDLNLIKTKSVISAFMPKLLLFKQRFAMGELCQFQNLIKVKKDGQVSDADVEVYRDHLQALHNDFTRRFEDILSMAIPDWVINPFTNVEDEEISLQIELLDLQSNAELKPRLAEGYQRFWLQKQIPNLYPNVWAMVKRWLICFPSSSLVECPFSVVTDLMTKKRNRLQLVKRGDLRLPLPPCCRTLIS